MFSLNLRSKLIAAFAGVFLVALAIVLLAMSQMRKERDSIVELADHRVPDAQSLGQATTIANKIRKDQMHYIIASPAERPDVLDDLKGDDADLADVMKSFEAGSSDAPYAKRLLGAISTYKAAAAPYKAIADRDEVVKAGQFLSEGSPDKAWDTVKDAMSRWIAAQRKAAVSYRADAVASADRAQTIVLAGLLVAALLAAGFAVLITRPISRTVKRVLSTLETLADHDARELRVGLEHQAGGDLSYDVQSATPALEGLPSDELGRVGRAANRLREGIGGAVDAYSVSRHALTEMIGEVAGSAGSVSSSSEQLASSSSEVGRAITEIASSIGEVAGGAERQVRSVESAREHTETMVSATTDGSREAADATDAAEQARTLAAEGASSVARATEAMDEVRASSRETSEAIRELGAKSTAIGGIVATISGIAEQTNLLALNAAIEAARAGEQGRGFAVVAEEVRKLAEESQSAASSISSLIAEIQAETERAVAVVESGSARTEGGAATVEQARAAFVAIGEAVEDVTDRVGRIAASVERIAGDAASVQEDMGEVAAVAEESSASSQQVSAGTEQTSASTQQIAASAQELASTAQQLQVLVERFTLATAS